MNGRHLILCCLFLGLVGLNSCQQSAPTHQDESDSSASFVSDSSVIELPSQAEIEELGNLIQQDEYFQRRCDRQYCEDPLDGNLVLLPDSAAPKAED